MNICVTLILAITFWVFASPASESKPTVIVKQVKAKADSAFVEIRGVEAGAFDPAIWKAGTLNWVEDARFPMLEPRQGAARNIYAPSAVETSVGWRLFYGAWDGVPTGNDRIYSVITRDFLSFTDRHTVIEHGEFVHVCNVSAVILPGGSYTLICTGYPDKAGLNKPLFFTSPNGKVWNGSPAPYSAKQADIIQMKGYDGYDAADINGMNVVLYEKGSYRLYFGNFKDFGKVYRASGTDGKNFTFEGKVLDGAYAVNDVKKFRTGSSDWYLMGLHMNSNKIWYTLSPDGLSFPAVQELGANISPADRYIVAVGWVVRGDQEKPNRRVLGVLYGAGADSGLASNRIFARWLQKRVVFVSDDGRNIGPSKAMGPERQMLPIDDATKIPGRFEVYSEDGKTLLGTSEGVSVKAGEVYQMSISNK